MTNTLDLIARLSSEAKPSRPLRAPGYWCVRLFMVLALYAVAAQLLLGLRPGLAVQFTRPFFALEIALLSLLLLTSGVASVLAMYPDAHQKPQLLKLPYGVFFLLAALVLSQLLMPRDMRMVMPEAAAHGVECALCIASVALIPSALIFALLRKGASIRQFQAGSFAALAASSIGCLTLRLSEANDSLVHLASWHYLPTLLFASIGAYAGKWLLKW
jgi:hypothetical protein